MKKTSLSLYLMLFFSTFVNNTRLTIRDQLMPVHLLLLPILLYLLVSRKAGQFRIGKLLSIEFVILALMFIPFLTSVWVSQDPIDSLVEILKQAVYVVSSLIFAQLVVSRRQWTQLMWLFVLFAGIVISTGLYSYFFVPFHRYRLVVTEGGANQFPFVAEMVPIILFGLAITTRDLKRAVVYAIGFSFFAYNLILTFSRGTWIAVAIGCTIFVFTSLKRLRYQRLVLFAPGLIAAMLLLTPESAFLRLQSIWNGTTYYDPVRDLYIEPSNENRFGIMEEYIDEIKQRPLTGRGFGLFLDSEITNSSRSAHNSYLAMWAYSGFLAFVLLTIFLGIHAANLWHIRMSLNTLGELWGNLLFASFIAILAHLMVGNFYFSYFFWVVLGLHWAALNLYPIIKQTPAHELPSYP